MKFFFWVLYGVVLIVLVCYFFVEDRQFCGDMCYYFVIEI